MAVLFPTKSVNYKINKNNIQSHYLNKMMQSVILLPVLMLMLVNNYDRLTVAAQSSELDHAIDLDENYRLQWRVIDEEIFFEIQVRTTGYVGFGFSRDGTIYGADLVIGWIDEGHAYFQVGGNH